MLKALMLRKRIDDANKALAALREKDAEFATREAELTADIEEASTEEERGAVEEAITAFEEEKTANETAKADLESQIRELEKELDEIETNQQKTPEPAEPAERKNERMETMPVRNRIFSMNAEERTAFFAREDVKGFLTDVRNIKTRAIGNSGVLIPEVMLPYLEQIAEETSKMVKHVNLVRVPGKGRMIIDGGYPEGVWTEMCANLNELEISFNDIEIDGYKVGGYIKVCNALLEDSDIALASDIITKLGKAIGYALDKAILYGTGTKMPTGIVTRLAQTEAPASYPATARTWADLHTTNIVSVTAANSTGVKLFQSILTAFGAASNKYANGARWFAMNSKTYNKLLVESMSINASGAIVAGMGDTMPVIGGPVITLDWMADNNIVAGYDGLYLLGERAGAEIGQSEHQFFTSDQTVFKGTARYDGAPAIAEGFVAIGIAGATPASTATFASDTANT